MTFYQQIQNTSSRTSYDGIRAAKGLIHSDRQTRVAAVMPQPLYTDEDGDGDVCNSSELSVTPP